MTAEEKALQTKRQIIVVTATLAPAIAIVALLTFTKART